MVVLLLSLLELRLAVAFHGPVSMCGPFASTGRSVFRP